MNRVINFFCLVLVFLCGCADKGSFYKETSLLMGTFVEVYSSDKRAANIVFEEIRRVESLLSVYDRDSQLSRLNRDGFINADEETFYIITKAKQFWSATNGVFDITVGPLVELWGFKEHNYRRPDKEEINRTRELTGFEKIIIDKSSNNLIKFKFPGMKIDLGAIAKGYAVDCAVGKLKESGIRDCLINAGGDIYCLGSKAGRPWRVAIRDPENKGVGNKLELYNQAVATSGDYEQFFIMGDKKYSHIINPLTGYPVDSGVVSATVVADDCLTADVLATIVSILGKDEGSKLINKYSNASAQIIEDKRKTL